MLDAHYLTCAGRRRAFEQLFAMLDAGWWTEQDHAVRAHRCIAFVGLGQFVWRRGACERRECDAWERSVPGGGSRLALTALVDVIDGA